MTDPRDMAVQYARQNGERFLTELEQFLSIPSISTDDEHKPDIQRAAEWLAAQLRALGMDKVQIMPTAKHPVVYAEWLGAGKKAPTVLIYGHYDVQPVDPLDLWKSPPFEPSHRGENLYARGASDMKGQGVAALKAVEAIIHNGGLQVNVKWLLEGEEEIGSPNLEIFIAGHKALLACDISLNPDAGMIGPDMPTITYALRGMAYYELRVYGPAGDLHSGLFGGVVHNPAQVLCELIAGMHDAQGRVTFPGFYESVRSLSDEERAELARLPTDEAYYLKQTGVPSLWGEVGYSPVERTGARPTLEVNGLFSGFTGQGSKTVLPAWAMAKISMRLVPNQTPAEVDKQIRRYLEVNAPKDVRWEVIDLNSAMPSIMDRDNFAVQAMSRALEMAWGRRPYFRREGGSIPIVAQLQALLGVESVVAGFGLPDDNAHAPNEKLHLPTWYKGIQALIHFFFNLKP